MQIIKNFVNFFRSQNEESGFYYNIWLKFKDDKVALFSLIILCIIILLIISAPFFSPYNHIQQNLFNAYAAPNLLHCFGTDGLGRDLFTRVMIGGRVTLLIGFFSTLVSVLFGTLVGTIAGYFGGKTDTILMRVVDILYGLPFMFFVIILTTLFGRNFFLIFFAIGAVSWLDMARVVRGQTLDLKRKDFVIAANASGVKDRVIIMRHIIGNLTGIISVYATLTVPSVIITVTFLSFLGLGVQPPMADWGSLISEGVQVITFNYWWLLVIPSFFLSLTLLCFNFIGYGLRNAFDSFENK